MTEPLLTFSQDSWLNLEGLPPPEKSACNHICVPTLILFIAISLKLKVFNKSEHLHKCLRSAQLQQFENNGDKNHIRLVFKKLAVTLQL